MSLTFSKLGVIVPFSMTEDPYTHPTIHDAPSTAANSDDISGMATNSIKLLTGNSHPQLAKDVADRSVESFLQAGRFTANPRSEDLVLSLPRSWSYSTRIRRLV